MLVGIDEGRDLLNITSRVLPHKSWQCWIHSNMSSFHRENVGHSDPPKSTAVMVGFGHSTVVKLVIIRAWTQVMTSSHTPVTIKRPTNSSTNPPVSWIGRRWVRSHALTRPAR